MFAPPSGQANSLFGGSAVVSTASQPSIVKGAQSASLTSTFAIPQQPVSQSQTGVNIASQLQRAGTPKTSSVRTGSVVAPGSSAEPGSRGVATTFNRNDANISFQSQVPEEKKATESKEFIATHNAHKTSFIPGVRCLNR